MKVVYCKHIPFKGFVAISLFGVVIVRKEFKGYLGESFYKIVINHERIHWEQQKELLIIPFFVLYLLEWIYRIIFHTSTAYRGISFEREAYDHETDLKYKRKHFAQWSRKNN